MLIAVTGGIAEGKSTVLKMLSEVGWRTGSADDTAREIFGEEQNQRAISELSGLPLPIDRGSLRQLVATDLLLRRRLNRLMHPLITERLLARNYQVVEIPLLIEGVLLHLAQEIWVVSCGPTEQLRRLTERLGSSVEASALISTQVATRAKFPFAHRVIRTNQPLDAVQVSVLEGIAAFPFA